MRPNSSKFKFLFTFLTIAAVFSFSCADYAAPEKTVIAIGHFSHETCTFCPEITTVDDWEYYGPPSNDINSMGGYVRGFVNMAEEYKDVELVGLTSPGNSKGGSSKSWITLEAFDKYTGLMAEDLKKLGKVDGLYLSLHGAMAVTDIGRPEAEIVKRMRAVVGPDVPIMITLDLHANEDRSLSDAADGVFITKRYPHYDAGLQGERAARVMMKTIRGDYKPVMATRKPGVITPSVMQGTGVSPAKDIMERARRWENQNLDVFVSVAFGFAYADLEEVGATVMVVTNDDQELADKIADDMNDYIWRIRADFAGKQLPKTKDGVTLAIKAARNGETPVIVADHADRSGNASHILGELINQGAKNFCITTLRDEKAIDKVFAENKQGDTVTLELGGYADRYAGKPVTITGKLEFMGEYGRDKIAVLLFGDNNRVIITPVLNQVTTTSIFPRLNLDLDKIDIVVLKSRVHFRRGFHETGIAGAIIEVDAPGWGPADLSGLPYTRIPKDIYPLFKQNDK